MKTSTKSGKKVGKSFSSDKLDAALMSLFDVFEKAACPFFLLGETARSILKDGKLNGEYLEVGIYDRWATAEVLSALNTVVNLLALETDEGWENQERGWGAKVFREKRDKVITIEFRVDDVPVVVRVVKKKSKYFSNLDSVVYNFDDYKIPNPFDSYYKVRGLIT